MNLNHLLTLAALAETGSFIGAARRLRLPPSTVTGHIAALESVLGVTLVIRTTRSMRLTTIGAQLAADATQIAQAAAEAEAHVARARTAPMGSLRVAMPVAFAHDLFAPLIGQFMVENPGVAVDIRVSNARDDLISEGIDLAIRVGNPGGQSLHARKLCDAATAIYAHETAQPVTTLSGLQALPWLAFSADSTLRSVGPNGPQEQRMHAAMTANDPKVIARAVAAGAGAALLPQFLMVGASVQRLLPDHMTDPVPIFIVAQGSIAATPAARRLADYLVANVPRHI